MLFRLIMVLFISFGCNNKQYDQESCNDLSMKKYKGFPDAHKKFDENCLNLEIKYTPQLCQSALIDLMKNNNLRAVQEKYGDPIQNCFTGDDLRRFNQK